jgi:sodium/potassium-transporting ATPase subunit alpha
VQSVAFLDRSFDGDQMKLVGSSSDSVSTALEPLVKVARLCNGASFVGTDDTVPAEERPIKGDATDTAVLRFAESFNLHSNIDTSSILASHDKVFEIPFNSRNKWMLSVVRERKAPVEEDEIFEPWMLVKGAPDVLFPFCISALNADGTEVSFDDHVAKRLSTLQSDWSSQGQRVLALCRRSLGGLAVDFNHISTNAVEETMYSELRNLTLVGLIGIRDPPRHDVRDAIGIIRRAGVRVFMVTGDFKLTAVAIARQVCCHLLCRR